MVEQSGTSDTSTTDDSVAQLENIVKGEDENISYSYRDSDEVAKEFSEARSEMYENAYRKGDPISRIALLR